MTNERLVFLRHFRGNWSLVLGHWSFQLLGLFLQAGRLRTLKRRITFPGAGAARVKSVVGTDDESAREPLPTCQRRLAGVARRATPQRPWYAARTTATLRTVAASASSGCLAHCTRLQRLQLGRLWDDCQGKKG